MSTILGNPITLGGGVNIKISRVLDENSWKAIKWASENNVGANLWSVGDCKEVTMNGKVSDGLTLSNYSAWVYIIGFNHNAEREGNGIAFQGFKATNNGTPVCLTDSGYKKSKTSGTWFNMDNGNNNIGGWKSSGMRKKVIPLIKAAFPADLQAVIKTSTIYTDNKGGQQQTLPELTATQDDVFLLAEYEISGTCSHANNKEANYLKQYAYYAAGNSKVKYRHNETSTAAGWWERSPRSGYSDYFCFVGSDGGVVYSYANGSRGVSPAFKV